MTKDLQVLLLLVLAVVAISLFDNGRRSRTVDVKDTVPVKSRDYASVSEYMLAKYGPDAVSPELN